MHGVKLKEMRVNPARVNRGSLSKEGLNQGEGQTKVTKMPRLLNHHPFGEGRRCLDYLLFCEPLVIVSSSLHGLAGTRRKAKYLRQ
ncbi:hypothetical protein SUGI_0665440 [Cryptomeria japonica]|nr:hypothetical protein SUGI_0665440 [Cryptomeria japonica]